MDDATFKKITDKFIGKLRENFIVDEGQIGILEGVLRETLQDFPLVKRKELSGYNVFMRETMAEFKDLPQQERIKQCAARWQNLSEGEQEEWRAKAKATHF
jgi:HMG-box domain